ncbi:hypothetical protein [Formosa haliotis]|uniref:hypothetical protein n=1 Tax=Formosa haliotis TaxID=1555194 RepID=UPI000825A446|nr:hypothetical protein [Formosa haliotis]
MNQKIKERIQIIFSLKSNLADNKIENEKRIKFLKKSTVIELVLTIILAGIVVLSKIFEHLDLNVFKWIDSGLLILLALSSAIYLPNGWYELKLLKHLKFIDSKSDFVGIDTLNNELQTIIDHLNAAFNRFRGIRIYVFFIAILVLWHLGSDTNNPYWDFMKLPVLVFYGYLIIRFINTNRKLSQNIEMVEHSVVNS